MDNQPEAKNPIQRLRSYRSDVQAAVKNSKASVSSIAVTEQNRRESITGEMASEVNTEYRNKIFFILGILFTIASIIGITISYYTKLTNQIVAVQNTKTLVSFAQEKIVAERTRDELINAILKEKNNPKLSSNSVLYLNTAGVDGVPSRLKTILSVLAPKIPPSLVSSFTDEYMFGVYVGKTNTPFIILKTDDFTESYSGMLKWEKDMVSDLGRVFGIEATTTPPVFMDKSLKSRDLRVIQDEDENTVLLYSFIDKQTLIITTDETVFEAVSGKYIINQNVR